MELVRVTVTPQGTADVFIGELHIKTFGGTHAHQAASDFAQQIRNEISKNTYQGPFGSIAAEEQPADAQTKTEFRRTKWDR